MPTRAARQPWASTRTGLIRLSTSRSSTRSVLLGASRRTTSSSIQLHIRGFASGTTQAAENIYYHVVYFLGFALDQAYVQGNNNPPCNTTPGTPVPGGNGGTGCLKGWGTVVSMGPGTVTPNPGPGGPGTPLRIQLIK